MNAALSKEQERLRVELKKGSHHIVFVLGTTFGVPENDVHVHTYDGMVKVSTESYSIAFARHNWAMLVTKGCLAITSKERETRPLYGQE